MSIKINVCINGKEYSSVNFASIEDALHYQSTMEKIGNRYIIENPKEHFMVILRSEEHGNDVSEIYFEDKVLRANIAPAEKIIDSMELK
jgi:hypothetical protein